MPISLAFDQTFEIVKIILYLIAKWLWREINREIVMNVFLLILSRIFFKKINYYNESFGF